MWRGADADRRGEGGLPQQPLVHAHQRPGRDGAGAAAADEAQAALAGYEDRLSVAVSNSRRSTVLSGEPAALGAVLSKLKGQGIFCKQVKVDVAAHSPQVDVLREDLLSAFSDLLPRAPILAMRSTVTGQPVGEEELGATYWADNARQPVRLAEVVDRLVGEGHGIFVELSPHPVLLPALEELVGDSGTAGTVTGSLYRDRPERASMLAAAGRLHVVGGPLRLERLYGEDGRRVELPTYAWDRQRYWLEALRCRCGGSGAVNGCRSWWAKRKVGQRSRSTVSRRKGLQKRSGRCTQAARCDAWARCG